jgi:hypothetical protein
MNAEKKFLLKEYELCQQSTQQLESLIWQTSGVVGIGAIGSLVALAVQILGTTEQTSGSPPTSQPQHYGFLFILGLVIIIVVWIWWGMAKRWWDIQHLKFLRMAHIEEDLCLFQTRYSHFRNGAINENGTLELTTSGLAEKYQKQVGYFPRFKRKGVQKNLRYLPWLVTFTWPTLLVVSLLESGRLKMDVLTNLLTGGRRMEVLVNISIGCLSLTVGIWLGALFHKIWKRESHAVHDFSKISKTVCELKNDVTDLKDKLSSHLAKNHGEKS